MKLFKPIVLDILYFFRLIFLSILLLFPLSLLLHLWKCIVNNVFKPNDLVPAEFLDTWFISKEDFSKPQVIFDILVTLKGELDFETFIQDCSKNIFNLRKIHNFNKYKYSRFRQFPVKWFGYLFYKNDENFDPRNHIRIEKDKTINQDNVYEFISSESSKPFKDKCSPWDILLIPKYNGSDKTLIYWRIQHSVCDRLSVLKCLMTDGFKGSSLQDDLEKVSIRCKKMKEFGRLSLKNLYNKTIGWPRFNLQSDKLERLQRLHFYDERKESHIRGLLYKIPLEQFNFLCKKKKMSMSFGLQLLICGALNSFLKTIPKMGKDSFYVNVPLPDPNHPANKMVNKMKLTHLYIQSVVDGTLTNELENIQNQLVLQHKEKADFYSSVNNNIMEFLISPMTEQLKASLNLQSIMLKIGPSLVNIMGPTKKVFLWNQYEVEDMEFWHLPYPGSQVVFSILSYNGNLNVSFSSCWKELWSKEQVKILQKEMHNCLDEFLQIGNH